MPKWLKHMNDPKNLSMHVLPDIVRASDFKTVESQLFYCKLAQKAWTAVGEKKVADLFNENYCKGEKMMEEV